MTIYILNFDAHITIYILYLACQKTINKNYSIIYRIKYYKYYKISMNKKTLDIFFHSSLSLKHQT